MVFENVTNFSFWCLKEYGPPEAGEMERKPATLKNTLISKFDWK